MSRDPVERVLNHNMRTQPYDPIFNPEIKELVQEVTPYNPHQSLLDEDFQPPTDSDR